MNVNFLMRTSHGTVVPYCDITNNTAQLYHAMYRLRTRHSFTFRSVTIMCRCLVVNLVGTWYCSDRASGYQVRRSQCFSFTYKF